MTDAAARVADGGALSDAVAQFMEAQAQHGIPAVSLEVVERDGRPLVTGTVLTARQAGAARDLARRHGVTAELVIAADPRSGMEEGWCVSTVPLLDLWREPGRAGEEMGRQTQYLQHDGPLRRFGEAGAFVLVQGMDLAMGWARAGDLEHFVPGRGRHPWAAVARATDNSARRPPDTQVSSLELVAGARRELGVPYVWGGTTHAGFDCSGLVQRLLLEGTGILLPRHTGDQRRVGERVLPAAARAGDLLFATPRGQKVGHVLLMTSATAVLHACRTEHSVIEESLPDNAARYQHQGWRRPVWLGEAPE
ncbi:MAG: C40 family peptidase [Candidatus Dormibacteria bacterium]